MTKSKKRDIVGEIIEIKNRQRYLASIYDAQGKIRELKALVESDEICHQEFVKYFPISLVACLEVGFRLLIKGLIDYGPPYLDKAPKILGDIKFDYKFISTFHGTKISMGDLTSHLIPLSSLDHIFGHLSCLLDINYAEELTKAIDYDKPVIDDKNRVYSSVARCFELRHIFCHEVTAKISIDKQEATQLIHDCELFLKAAATMHLQQLSQGPGLSQREMNIQSGRDLKKVEEELAIVIEKIREHLIKRRFREFMSAQKKWQIHMKSEATYRANQAKGGSIWPTFYCDHAIRLSKKRIEELNEYLLELAEFGDLY